MIGVLLGLAAALLLIILVASALANDAKKGN